jgi:hypothetical protein
MLYYTTNHKYIEYQLYQHPKFLIPKIRSNLFHIQLRKIQKSVANPLIYEIIEHPNNIVNRNTSTINDKQ